ncbi:DNA-formamidopyrimidine glycosylase family protein [uncultured Flavobacterium sp.]|uniref:DNA-formamidopyrimidine glycosylase family protein n=1 Tax=uncultured Flavobacterium sp. TaxID=165435 RepID=UPI0025DAF26C|nr:DNA-formamidopyrimidine glycosylase family protein [uncultured Flavobacterium sp.]
MPEGPSIIIAKEAIDAFENHVVLSAEGNAKIDMSRLEHKKLMEVRTWGKHLLLCFSGFTLRIHFLMFGTYLVNERKTTPLKLRLTFRSGELNFYTSNIKLLEGDVNDHYDWSADVMNDSWSAKKAMGKLKEMPGVMVCDALLDQDIFAGVGNIIKNEALYRAMVHPKSKIGKIPPEKLAELIDEAGAYSFDFLKWKKKDELKKHWQAYTKKKCMRCDLPMMKEYTGTTRRRSFFCDNCQKLYG